MPCDRDGEVIFANPRACKVTGTREGRTDRGTGEPMEGGPSGWVRAAPRREEGSVGAFRPRGQRAPRGDRTAQHGHRGWGWQAPSGQQSLSLSDERRLLVLLLSCFYCLLKTWK